MSSENYDVQLQLIHCVGCIVSVQHEAKAAFGCCYVGRNSYHGHCRLQPVALRTAFQARLPPPRTRDLPFSCPFGRSSIMRICKYRYVHVEFLASYRYYMYMYMYVVSLVDLAREYARTRPTSALVQHVAIRFWRPTVFN